MSGVLNESPGFGSLKLADLKPKSDWVKDKDVKTCEECGTNFSVFTRKHHCRRCGHIMCKSCCSKVLVEKKKVLICMPCQEHTGQRGTVVNQSQDAHNSTASGGWFGRQTHTRKSAMQPREVNLDELRMLPARYLKKHPQLDDSLINGFGSITITAIEATGLVAADINLIGKNSSDPYLEMLVGEHEKSVSKTKVIKSSLTPKWHSKHRFPIHSPFAEITIKVYDEDLASGDDVLGMVSFSLSCLLEHTSSEQDFWVYLHEAPGQTDHPNKCPCVLPEGAVVGIGGCCDKPNMLGALHLKFSIDYDKEGEYLAHFVRELAPVPPQPEMDMDLLYGNIFAMQDQVWPILDTIWATLALIQWVDLTRSRVALTIWMSCCYWPWLIPLVLHWLLLRHIKAKYDELLANGSRSRAESDLEGSNSPHKEKEEKHAATLGWVGTMMNSSKLMMPKETKEWLRGIQNMLGSNAEMIDGIYGLFDWRDYATTKSVTIGLCVSFVLHATILSFGYTMMIIGAVMFTFFTSLWLDLTNALNGYLTYRSNSLSLIKPGAGVESNSEGGKNKTV